MDQQVDAIYENGVLKPLGPLNLAEHQRVAVTVSSSPHAFVKPSTDEFRRLLREFVAKEKLPTLPGTSRADIYLDHD